MFENKFLTFLENFSANNCYYIFLQKILHFKKKRNFQSFNARVKLTVDSFNSVFFDNQKNSLRQIIGRDEKNHSFREEFKSNCNHRTEEQQITYHRDKNEDSCW